MRTCTETLICLLALVGAAGSLLAQSPPPADKPVAVVNGEVIQRAEFESMWSKVPPAPPGTPETQRKAMRAELLMMLVDETLFQQFLRRTVPAPDPSLVDQRIKELDASLKARGKTLADYYRDSGQSESRLRTDITAVVQWNAYIKKKFTDDDLKKYYLENKELFDGVMIRASHIFLKCPKDADARTHQATVQKMQTIWQDLARGVDFSEAAKKHSQDEVAAKAGGDLGYFPPNKQDPDPFLRTVSTLKTGQVSDIVQTSHGYHLIKVTDRKVGKPSTFEQCKEEARVLVAEELRSQIVAEERKAAKLEMNLP